MTKVKELGRSEGEVLDTLARMAKLRREQVKYAKPWPVEAYVAAAMTLILSARPVLADALAEPGPQMIKPYGSGGYCRHRDLVEPLHLPRWVERPVRVRPSFLKAVWNRFFG